MAGRPRTKIKRLADLFLTAFELRRQIERERPAQYGRAAFPNGKDWLALLEKDKLAAEWNETETVADGLSDAIQSLIIETAKRAKIDNPYLDRLPNYGDERPIDVIRTEVFAKHDQATAPSEPHNDEDGEEIEDVEGIEGDESECVDEGNALEDVEPEPTEPIDTVV